MSGTRSILVVEDDPDLAFGLEFNLRHEGYEVAIASDGPAGLVRARAERPALVVLDVMLPGLDGFRVLERLRAEGLTMPVLMLTARAAEADKVRGLRGGADDYLTKPFGVMELVARVEALLRRSDGRTVNRPELAAGAERMRLGDVAVDLAARSVSRAGTPVDLAPLEFDLLCALLRRAGAVATRRELLREVWGYADSVVSRTVDAHVAMLRRKLEPDPLNPSFIVTVRKAGYRIAAAAP
ncbi:MAG TPA: response regulator transcription factor [Gemmatimonadales bacterium]|nr:response regulator transcription factor [Gemmatimonadales bacterium]